MPRIVILDSYTTDQGLRETWDGLGLLGELTVHARSAPDEVAGRLVGADMALTNKVPFDAALIEAAVAGGLRYIGVLATGVNIIDLAAARAAGIAVTNVPGYSTESVAQLVFAHILQVASDVGGHDARVHAGDWESSADFAFFTRPLIELAGKTLAIIGMGAIGGAVARLARAFGMEVLAVQLPGRPAAADKVPLDEALSRADVISLHCPLTSQTQGLVDAAFLARCRPGAILVNTGRGPLIDEAALAVALDAGRPAWACLDVLSKEPPAPGHPLTRHPRCVVTPHIAWGTVEARARLVREVEANIRAFVAGERRNRVE